MPEAREKPDEVPAVLNETIEMTGPAGRIAVSKQDAHFYKNRGYTAIDPKQMPKLFGALEKRK